MRASRHTSTLRQGPGGIRVGEVHRAQSGDCELWLHGSAHSAALDSGICDIALGLSREGDYATAVAMAQHAARGL